jgi:hypothetical protein
MPVYSSPVPVYCSPPQQPPLPVTRGIITQISDDGNNESPKAEMEGEASPRSVLTSSRPAAATSAPVSRGRQQQTGLRSAERQDISDDLQHSQQLPVSSTPLISCFIRVYVYLRVA